jgi:hypothetical protein
MLGTINYFLWVVSEIHAKERNRLKAMSRWADNIKRELIMSWMGGHGVSLVSSGCGKGLSCCEHGSGLVGSGKYQKYFD